MQGKAEANTRLFRYFRTRYNARLSRRAYSVVCEYVSRTWQFSYARSTNTLTFWRLYLSWRNFRPPPADFENSLESCLEKLTAVIFHKSWNLRTPYDIAIMSYYYIKTKRFFFQSVYIGLTFFKYIITRCKRNLYVYFILYKIVKNHNSIPLHNSFIFLQ